MNQGFLGNGWRFDLSQDETKAGIGVAGGRIAEARDEALIQQSIWLILSTAPGERVMRPDFGCGIHDLVFSNPSHGTLGEVIREVTRALTLFEPRIELRRVDARADVQNPSLILVEIDADIRSTNSRFNLVFPFYVS
jgi:uncharacterized protein